MTEYRYATTSLLTGALLADELPLHVQSFGEQILRGGQLTGYLDLSAANQAYLRAGVLEPERTVLWVLEDGYPVWHGIIWDWPVQSILTRQLPISASTPRSLFARRRITDSLDYTDTDYAEVWRQLVSYATGPLKGAAAMMAGLQLQSTVLGSLVSTSYVPGDLKAVDTALGDLETAGDFETWFAPTLDANGNLATLARIATQLGQPYQATGVQLVYPGNLADYSWPRIGSQGANTVYATAPANTVSSSTWLSNSVGGHGLDAADLAGGAPLLETTVQYSGAGITDQAQIDAYADGYLAQSTGVPTNPGAVVDMSSPSAPRIKSLGLGDWAALLATSELHPARADGSPGVQQLVRMIGWNVVPPDMGQDGKITLSLGEVSG